MERLIAAVKKYGIWFLGLLVLIFVSRPRTTEVRDKDPSPVINNDTELVKDVENLQRQEKPPRKDEASLDGAIDRWNKR